jgi:hypothetical protein
MSASTLQKMRDTLLQAARDARYRPHAELAPAYVQREKQSHRELLKLPKQHHGETRLREACV